MGHCSQLLVKSMIIREKYMILSQQSFPSITAKYLNKAFLINNDRNISKENDIFKTKEGTFFSSWMI